MPKSIGIRRENLDKRGEQRVAVPPEIGKKLIETGHNLVVQSRAHPSTGEIKRAFADENYRELGATLQEDLSNTDLIFGLKEVKVSDLIPRKVYAFFSHTHKGQHKNRPLLKAMVEKEISLVDYELITNDSGQRLLTAFTFMAGYAGMIDSLWALGRRYESKGNHSLWAEVKQSIEYKSLEEAKLSLVQLGRLIQEEGTDETRPPLICCFLGNGRTSKGAQEIFDILPTQEIELKDLAHIFSEGSRRKVYKLVLDIPELYRIKKDSEYADKALAREDIFNLYFEEPHHFESNLDTVLPYCTLLMNCILWSPKYPRLITREEAKTHLGPTNPLAVVGDITCDPEGAIQFSQETWIDDPVFTYDPLTDTSTPGFGVKGISVMAVTNLPCEFSADSSLRFGKELEPFLLDWINADFQADSVEEAGLPGPIRKAVILWKGNFTPEFAYMKEFIA